MASSFYDEGIKIRQKNDPDAPSASFKIRQQKKFKPNISEMKTFAGRPDKTFSNGFRRADNIGAAADKDLTPYKDAKNASKVGLSPSQKLVKGNNLEQ